MKTGFNMDKPSDMVEISLGPKLQAQHTQETNAVFMTKDGDQIQENIKLTDVEAIFSNDDFTMIYDFSKGLIVHRWYKVDVDAVHDSCFVESFNTSQFVRLDRLKSMIDTVKPNQVNSVEKDESVTYVSTDIRLPNNALGPASRSLCHNKDVFFIRRVPVAEITGDVAYILQKAELVRYTDDDIIERHGDVGGQFYIILEGKVSVYIDTKQEEKAPPTDDNPSLSRKQSIIETLDNEHGIDLEDTVDSGKYEIFKHEGSSKTRDKKVVVKKDEKRSRKKFGQLVNTLGRYQSFGELALLYPNRTRNATVIADEPTEIVTISEEVFKITLLDTLEKDFEEKRIFIQTHPFFSKWSIPMQRQLQWSLVRQTHRIGDTVIRQGDEISGLYFLVSGRARLAAEPMRHRVQFPELFTKPTKKEGERSPMKREDTSLTDLTDMMRTSKSRRNLLAGMDPLTYIRRTDGYAAAEKALNEKLVDLCIIEEGEVVCDSELLVALEFNAFSVICSTACTFYRLDAKAFDRLVYKKSPFTLSMMKIMADTKLTRRLNTQQGEKMPLLSPLLSKILDVRVVDPNAEDKSGDPMVLAFAASRMDQLPRSSVVTRRTLPRIERSKTILMDWYMQGKTPLLQPITRDAIYYRELIQKRAKYREISRQRLPKEHRQVKSLERRIKDTFWFNLKEGIRATNTMKRLKLQNSDSTPVSRWK